MCPGGFIVPSPTESGHMAINGMSNSNRSAPYANSGVVVQVTPKDLLRHGYGDTPLIGCGVYADDEAGAVSMTGLGESIIRIAAAKEIVDRLEAGASPATAVRTVLHKLMFRVKGSAGALVLAPDGRFSIRHTTLRMCAGYWDGTGVPVVTDRFAR